MDSNNWRPAQGTEPSIEPRDWRAELPPESRQKVVDKIIETLKKHLPVSGAELQKIAQRFEEKIFSIAASQSDYLQKISLKMHTMESRYQNPSANNMLGRQHVVPQQQQQQSQNQQKILYQQQQILKNMLQMSQMQQKQQQSLMQPNQLQSSQQSVMQPSMKQTSLSSLPQNQQSNNVPQSTQSTLKQHSQAIRHQQQPTSIAQQQQTVKTQQRMLPAQQQQLMDSDNWRPAQGTELTTEPSDWRAELPPESRQKIVDKIWVGETSAGPSTVPPTTTTMVSPTVVPEVPISAAPAEPATITDKVAEDTSFAEPLVPVPPIMDPPAPVCPHCPHCSYPAKPLLVLGDPIDGRPTIRTWTSVDAIIVESEDEEEEEELFEYAPEDFEP